MSIEILLLILFIVSTLLGSFLHFTHVIIKKGFILHVVSAVNESTWEHMKLAYMPIFIISLILHFVFLNDYQNILEGGFYSAIISILLIPLIYYPLKRILKKEILWVSISLYVFSMLAGFSVFYLVLNSDFAFLGEWLSLLLLIVVFLGFGIFTFYPPKIFLFRDPVTDKYGH